MAQSKFKVEQVNGALMQALGADEATSYFAVMTFQLGCSIGELIGMGVKEEQLEAACADFIAKAVKSRLSVNTKPVTLQGPLGPSVDWKG